MIIFLTLLFKAIVYLLVVCLIGAALHFVTLPIQWTFGEIGRLIFLVVCTIGVIMHQIEKIP